MKKLLTVIFIFSVVTFSASAQQSVEWGLKAGIQMTHLKGDDFEGVPASSGSRVPEKVTTKGGSALGYTVGGYVRTLENVFLQGELLVSVKGATLKRLSNNTETQIQYGQLDIPLSLGYKFKQVEISGGPLVSFQLFDNGNLQKLLSQYSTTPLTFSPYKSYAFGYQAGVGVHLNKITLGLRYLASIQPVNDMYISYSSGGNDPQLRNSRFQQSFGAVQFTAAYRLSK